MKKLDLNKMLRTVLLTFAIILTVIKLFSYASAEGMDQYYLDYLRPYFPDFTDEQWETVEESAVSCPYFIMLDSSNSAYRILILYPYSSEYVYEHNTGSGNTDPCYIVGGSSSNIGVGSFALSPYSLGNVANNQLYSHYAFIDYLSSHEAHGVKYYPSSQSYDSSSWSFRWYSCNRSFLIGSSIQNPSWAYDSTSYITNDNCVFETSYTAFTKFEKNLEKPLYTDTGFFNIWTSVNQASQKVLNISWPVSVYPSTGSMNYVKSVMNLTIEVNGTAQTLTFDSIENPELFPTSSGSYIPYTFLEKVANLAQVSLTDSFYLTMVSLTQYAYPAGSPASAATAYNETSLCSVNLGELQTDVPAVTPVPTIPISQTNIVDTSFFTNIVGGSVSPSIDYPVPSWANHVQVAVGEYPSAPYDLYLSWGYLEEISTLIMDMDYSFGSGSTLIGASAELVTEYFANLDYGTLFQKLNQDYLLDYADIVTFDCYNLDSSNNAYIVKRIVIYTDSYFYKMQLQSLGSIQDMIEANTYYTKAIYDYAQVRLDGMAQSLEKLRISNSSLLGSINANIINLQNLVGTGTDRIVSAIEGFSGSGLSMAALSSTLNNLFMPSFEWDSVNYQDYLDSLGVLALPFEFVFDTQSIIKNNYSSTIVLPIYDFSVPLGKDFNDNNIEFTVFEDQEDFEYDPTDIFPAALWSVFQYLAAFGLVIGEAWFTYVHIFRKEEKSGDF